MLIAICDDDENFSQSLKQLITKHDTRRNSFHCFSSGNELLFALEDQKRIFDLIFLDIEMYPLSGIETANILRMINKTVPIVIVTNYPEFWSHGYSVKALQYLLKPIEYNKVEPLLEEAEQIAEQYREESFLITNKAVQTRIYLREIQYFEISGEKITAFTQKGEYIFYGTMKQLEKALSAKGFFRIYKSILLNLSFFHKRNGMEMFLMDGTVLPIARNRVNGFKLAIMDWVQRGN